jgi:hypothetical protein
VTRTTIFLLLAAVVLVLSSLSAIRWQPTAMPREVEVFGRPATSRRSSVASAAALNRPLSEKYRVLLNRSIFARDGRSAVLASHVDPATPNTPGLWIGPPGTEMTLVFRGVTLSDGSFAVYIEDITGGGVRRFVQGDAIAAGRIAGITLNTMDYEADRKVTQVELGQNLAGKDAPPPAPPTTAPVAPPQAPPEPGARVPGRGRPPGAPPGPAPGPGAPSNGAE